MEKGRLGSIFLCYVTVLCFFLFFAKIHAHRVVPQIKQGIQQGHPVTLNVTNSYVEIDNGIIKLTLLNPTGWITSLGYKGIKNILEHRNKEGDRGYWDIVWSRPDRNGSHFDTLGCTRFQVITETQDQVEVSFVKTWNSSIDDQQVPLNIDKRYIIMRGDSGFYSYSIFERLQGWPALHVDEARIAFKLDHDMFHYMVIADNKHRIMPSQKDREEGKELDFKEAVLITNASNPSLQGEVDDKYMYSVDNRDNHVHGWISSNSNIGFWVIIPSDEFRAGGPIKQDLTSHAGPTSLATFFSGHYAGTDFGLRFRNGEAWKKVYGPVFIYLNSNSNKSALWEDAKRQAAEEIKKWPYDFPLSPDFPHAENRGSINGRLMVNDSAITAAKEAYVGLATPGKVGSWQMDTKGYQFWNKTDENGYFTIKGVRPGNYSLYAWVPGVIDDYKYDDDIAIQPGRQIKIGQVVYRPPRSGPTLWEIGIPDRTAAEFFVPDGVPGLLNKLYINHTEKYRQYGLWNKYTNYYPNQDLIYTVGESDYRKDWFFTQDIRRVNTTYVPVTWQIVFNTSNVMSESTYTLRIAFASGNLAEILIYMNNNFDKRPLFSTGRIGKDNAIARHGIHGLYKLFSVNISGSNLVDGTNTIHLRQPHGDYPFIGVMYDYIRLEGPPQA